MKTEVPATVAEVASSLGIARSTVYYHPKLPQKDEELKKTILKVWEEFPEYGRPRLAIHLGINHKRIGRVMRKFGLKAPRRRVRLHKPEDQNLPPSPFPNILATMCPVAPGVVWVADFTYIPFQGSFIYLATILDLFTREVIGWSILSVRTQELVKGAFEDALQRTGSVPYLFHSDQGSQYQATQYLFLLEQRGILISMSKKASPWQNPHQESYYSHFKLDLGEASRFETLGELVTEIHFLIYRYNHLKIHSALKCPPTIFRKQLSTKRRSPKLVQTV